jgi:hypothetical protein
VKASSAITPVALIVLATGAVAYAVLVDRTAISDADRASRERDVFPSFRVGDVRRVELVHGSELLVLDRSADVAASTASAGPDHAPSAEWRMTSPRHEPADAAAVDVLLRELEMAVRERNVSEADASGLDAPRVRGKVTVGLLEYRFALGGDAPRPQGAAYMRVEGEGTFVAPRSLTVQLLRGADAYRERRLVPYGAGATARVELRRGSTALIVLQRSGASFRTGGEQGLRASRAEVDRLFGALADLRVETFLNDQDAHHPGNAPSALEVLVTPRDPEQPRVRLLAEGPCPTDPERVVVERAEPARGSACVSKAAMTALAAVTSHESLADRSVLYARADEIEEVTLQRTDGAGVSVDIARRGSGWRERAPEDRDLRSEQADAANAFTMALANANATQVRRRGQDAFVPRFRATVVRTGGETTEVVELGAAAEPDAKEAEQGVLARRVDDDAILRLPASIATRFEPHPVAFRPLTLWDPPIDAAAVTAVDDSCGSKVKHVEMRDGLWWGRGGAEADATATNDLVAALVHAQAESWVAESDDGAFGLWSPHACTVALTAVTASRGPRRVGLVLGPPGEGGIYARTLDAPAVLVAPAALRDAAMGYGGDAGVRGPAWDERGSEGGFDVAH